MRGWWWGGKGGGTTCEETKTVAAKTSMSQAGPTMPSFIYQGLRALMEGNNNFMITNSRANQVNCDPSTLVPVSRLNKMQICPVLVRRTKPTTGKRVTHSSYADCLQSPCKHENPDWVSSSKARINWVSLTKQASPAQIRLEWYYFIEVAYFAPEIHCSQSLLYLQGTTFYRYRCLCALQINKQRPKVPADTIH